MLRTKTNTTSNFKCFFFSFLLSMDNILQICFIIIYVLTKFGTLLCEIRTNLLVSLKDKSLGNVILDCQKSSAISCINECIMYETQCQAASYNRDQDRCLLHDKHPLNSIAQLTSSNGFSLYYNENNECDDGWFEFDSKCYFFNMNRLTWDYAMAKCTILRSSLVKIEGAAENEFLRNKCKELNGLTYWIGARYSTVHGGYRWYDGTSITFTSWYPGDPDSNGCVDLLQRYDWYWNDHSDCNAIIESICERGNSNKISIFHINMQ